VATQQSRLKPGELYHLGGPALVVCSLHLPKIIEVYLRIQMLPAKLLLASLYVAHPVDHFSPARGNWLTSMAIKPKYVYLHSL